MLSVSEIKNYDKRLVISGQRALNLLKNTTGLADQAETIRRLRIQNKKLLEQVAIMRNKISVMKSEKIRLIAKLHDEKKLNQSLSKFLQHRSGNRKPITPQHD